MRVPEYQRQVGQSVVKVPDPIIPNPVRDAFGENVIRANQSIAQGAAELGSAVQDYFEQKKATENKQKVAELETQFHTENQDKLFSNEEEEYNVGPQKSVRPKGILNRQLKSSQGSTQDYDKWYFGETRDRYLESIKDPKYRQALAERMDSIHLSSRDAVIKNEAKQDRLDKINSFGSAIDSNIENAHMADNTDYLKLLLNATVETQKSMDQYQGSDSSTAELNRKSVSEKVVRSAASGALRRDPTGTNAKELVKSAEEYLSKEDIDELNNDIEAQVSKNRKAAQELIKQRETAYTVDLYTRIVNDEMDLEKLNEYKGKVSPKEYLAAKKLLKSPKTIDPISQAETFNRLQDGLENLGIEKDVSSKSLEQIASFRKDVVDAYTNGEITKGEFNSFMRDTSKAFDLKTASEIKKKAGFWNTLGNWSERYSTNIEESKARLGREFQRRVDAGEDPATVVEDIITNETISKHPSEVLRMKDGKLDPNREPYVEWTPAPIKLAKGFGMGVAGTVEGFGGAFKWLGAKEIGKSVSDYAQEMKDFYAVPDPSFDYQLAAGFGSTATFLIPGIGIAKGVQIAKFAPWLAVGLGISSSSVMEAMVEAGGSYQTMIEDNHKTSVEASKAAAKTFWLNLPIAVYTNASGIFGKSGKGILKALKSAGFEGVQELTQQVIQNWATENPDLFDQAMESASIGVIVGGGAGVVMGNIQELGDLKKAKELKDSIAEQQAQKTLEAEMQKPPLTERQIEGVPEQKVDLTEESPVQLGEEQKIIVKDIAQLLADSEGPQTIKDSEGNYTRLASGWPSFLTNRGYTREQLNTIFSKAMEGKPLTSKQADILNTVVEGYNNATQSAEEEIQTVDPEIERIKEMFPGEVTDQDLIEIQQEIEQEEVWDEEKYSKAVEKFIAKKKGGDVGSSIPEAQQGQAEGNVEDTPKFKLASPTFYSKLEQTVQAKMPNFSTPEQVRGILNNSGVKQEEVEWMDIDGFLSGKDKVSKQELVDYLKANAIQIKEVNYAEKADKKTIAQYRQDYDAANRRISEIAFDLGGSIPYVSGIPARWMYRDSSGNILEVPEQYQNELDGLSAIKQEYEDLGNSEGEEIPGNTKYATLQTPGGENYRELLLTLPVKSKVLPSQQAGEVVKRDGREFKPVQKDSGKWVFQATDGSGKELGRAFDSREELVSQKFGFQKDVTLEAPKFQSSHFDEPNILAHVRMNDRTDSDGKKVLFIEEIQSDWHQTGRKEGYKKGVEQKNFSTWLKDNDKFISEEDTESQFKGRNSDSFKQWQSEQEIALKDASAVPDAPFKKSWQELAMKRMLRYAAENGYDRIAWTTGEMQAERYDLSKQVESVEATRITKSYDVRTGKDKDIESDKFNIRIITPDGREHVNSKSAKELPDFLGKDLADKVIANNGGKYSGLDLKIGGEGMKGFYDQIIPSFLNKYAKKWGARVGSIEIPGAGEGVLGGRGAGVKTLGIVHSIDITPSMRESVLNEGQPMFKSGQEQPTWDALKADKSAIQEANDRGLALIREYVPQLADSLVNPSFLMTREGHRALGMYFKGKIYVTPGQGENVYIHELGHAVFDMFLTPQERAELIAEGKKVYGNADNTTVEEHIMSDFEKYFADQNSVTPQTVGEKIMKFFRDMFKRISDFFSYDKSAIQDFYDAILSGEYRDAESRKNFSNQEKYADTGTSYTPEQIASMTQEERQKVMTEKLGAATSEQHKQNILRKYGNDKTNPPAPPNSEGMDDGFYEKNRKIAKSTGRDLEIQKTAERLLTPISSRLNRINPKLKAALRKYEQGLRKGIIEDTKKVIPFMQATQNMSVEDKADMDIALKNGDKQKILDIVKRNNIAKEYLAVRTLLNDLYNRAKAAGYDVGFIEDYHPRYIQDVQGFLDYFRKGKDWSIIEEAIRKKQEELGPGKYLTDEEKAALVNSLYRGYSPNNIKLTVPSNFKERKIKVISPEANAFYMDSNSALVRYIEMVNEKVAAKEFFGKSEAATAPIEDSIGSFIIDLVSKGEINPSQEKELRDILQSRFNQRGTHGIVTALKNISYIDTMGSPISAITNIGEYGFSVYKNGYFKTGKSFLKAVAGKSAISKEDIGIERIAQEFSDRSKTGKALDAIFKVSGFTWMDNIAKETFINASHERIMKQAENPTKEFIDGLNVIFGEETDQVLKDIKSGEISDNVKMLLFSEISDVQPISLSEMPEVYLKAGNGRVWYMLKTYSIKQLDYMRNESMDLIAQGKAKEGLTNLVRLSAALVVMNAIADGIKDFILGREFDLGDVFVDNLLRLLGFSKWQIYKFKKEGPATAFWQSISPPMKVVDSAFKDMNAIANAKLDELDDLELIQDIPLVGKLYYWWFGKGEKKKSRGKSASRSSI